jgi:hypothetical protein
MTVLAATPQIVGLSRTATAVAFQSTPGRLMLGDPSAGQSSAMALA